MKIQLLLFHIHSYAVRITQTLCLHSGLLITLFKSHFCYPPILFLSNRILFQDHGHLVRVSA